MYSLVMGIRGKLGQPLPRKFTRDIQVLASTAGFPAERCKDPKSRHASSLPEYYAGKNLFLTGATGFCGKPIIEKLLRSCPDVQGIYCLTRPKRGKDPQHRLREMFNDSVFDRLKRQDKERSFIHKVHAVEGDICDDRFGLKESDVQMLHNKINCVVHSAATVSFNEPIDVAVNMNVLGARRGIELARGMKNLESYLHISTAYSNCNRRWMEVKEGLYEPIMPYQDVLAQCRSLPTSALPELQRKAKGDYPNTYSLTKCMAEHMLVQEAGDLPVSIIRPSIVISAYRDPTPGWICSAANHGLASILYWMGRGNLRGIQGYNFMNLDVVPVDIVTNSALAAIWRRVQEPAASPRIYNVTSSTINPCTFGHICDVAAKTYQKIPFSNTVKTAECRPIHNREEYLLKHGISHWCPAVGRDVKAKLTGSKQNQMKIANLMGKMNNNLSYFLSNQFNFKVDNFTELMHSLSPEDREEFCLDPSIVDWDEAIRLYALGIKRFIAGQQLPDDAMFGAKRCAQITADTNMTLAH